jgi:hypothetical protein
VSEADGRVFFDDPELEAIFRNLRLGRERPHLVNQAGQSRRANVVPIRAIEGGQALPAGWPSPLRDLAYRGPIGAYVEGVEPHSEADPAAILIQCLVTFGNALGRNPHIMIEENRHGTNLYVIVVGQSSRARKGVSWNRAYRPVADCDPDWAIKNTGEGGLSTGEGLVRAVQDSDDPAKHVSDKRFLAVMEELSEMLVRMKRDGNVLGSNVRLAWDGKPLTVKTKSEPLRAVGAHVSLITHVTEADLQSLLSERDVYNGFGNRFLYVAARRQRVLALGGEYDYEFEEYQEIVRELVKALDWAHRKPRRFQFSPRARVVWSRLYAEFADADESGHYSAVTDRAEPNILRLAQIYASQEMAEEKKAVLRVEHLKAAAEVWRYCEESARYLFSGEPMEGSSDGRVLEFLLEARGDWVAKAAITGRFKNVPTLRSYALDAVLDRLVGAGLAEQRSIGTKGRPRTEYRAMV